MPRVPLSNGPQLRVQALNPVRQQNIDVSSGGRALAAGLNDVSRELDRYDMRQAQASADQADAQITSAWLKWDAENRAKFRGQNADGYEAAAQEWWGKAAAEFGKDLSPRARELASRSLVRKQGTALANVVQFVGAEKERYFDESTEAKINTSIEFGVTTGDVAGAANQVRTAVADIGARKGWSTEMTQAETTKRLSTLHLTHIEKLVDTNADAAQAYYNAAKERGEILPTAQPRFERALKEGVDNQFATKTAAEWAALPLDEQLKRAADIDDPERRKRTLTEIKNNHTLVKEAERVREEQAADQAWQMVGQGKRVPPSILANMDGRARVQLQDHLRAVAERGPVAPKTDPKEHARLVDMMLNDPEGFKKERIAAARLSPTDLEQFAAKQQAMRSGKGEQQDTMLTDDQRVNGALLSNGIDAKKNPDAAYAVRAEIDRRVRAESAAKGGKTLTGDEKQRVVDAVLMDKVFVDEWGRDAEKPLAMVKPEDLGKAYVRVAGKDVPLSTVPATDRQQILASLKRRGLPATEQAVVQIYLMKKGQ